MTHDMGMFVAVLLVVMSIALYFIPTVVAKLRNHHNLLAIGLTNFFLGWTGIGWIVALVWAVMRAAPQGRAS